MRIAVVGQPGAWSTERLAAALRRRGAHATVVDLGACAVRLPAPGVWHAGQRLDVALDLAEKRMAGRGWAVGEAFSMADRAAPTANAPIAGRVLRIGLEPGDPVVADETVLATFLPADPVPLDARARAEATARARAAETALERAEAEREQAAAQRTLAASELVRARALSDDGILSRDELERSQTRERVAVEQLGAAEAAVRTARFELEQARATLIDRGAGDGRPIELHAPVDGVVLRRLHESEAVVPAGAPRRR